MSFDFAEAIHSMLRGFSNDRYEQIKKVSPEKAELYLALRRLSQDETQNIMDKNKSKDRD